MTTTQKKSKRDELRAATIGAKKDFKKIKYKWNGQEFEFRQPTIGVRSRLRDRCMDERFGIDQIAFAVWSVIECTYVPGTEEKVFDESDYDTILEDPTGNFLDTFADELAPLMNVETSLKKKSLNKTRRKS